MESTIAILHRRALQHSRQAAGLWKRSRQMLDSNEAGNLGAAFNAALDLNRKAIDECKKALNTIDFLRRYHDPRPLISEISHPASTNGKH